MDGAKPTIAPDTRLGEALRIRPARWMKKALAELAAARARELGREVGLSSVARDLLHRALRGDSQREGYASGYREGFAAGVHAHEIHLARRAALAGTAAAGAEQPLSAAPASESSTAPTDVDL